MAGRTSTAYYDYIGYVWDDGAVESWGIGSGPRGGGTVADINAARQVGANSDTRSAYLWENGTLTDLETPYNRDWGDSSAAVAINDEAQVVGRMNDHLRPTRAFLWEDGVSPTSAPSVGRAALRTTSTTRELSSTGPRPLPATGTHSCGRTA